MSKSHKKELEAYEFDCCSNLFSIKKIENYSYISKYKVVYKNEKGLNTGIKKYNNNAQVYYEVYYELACNKNGCTKVNIIQYSKNHTKLGVVRLAKQESVIKYINETFNLRQEQKIKPPIMRSVPTAKTIQLRYNQPKSKVRLQKMREEGKDWRKFLKTSHKIPLRGGKGEEYCALVHISNIKK